MQKNSAIEPEKSRHSDASRDADRWLFLEEMDAPRWADLSLDGRLRMERSSNEDSWFGDVHPFHQTSLYDRATVQGRGKHKSSVSSKFTFSSVVQTRGEPSGEIGGNSRDKKSTKYNIISKSNRQPHDTRQVQKKSLPSKNQIITKTGSSSSHVFNKSKESDAAVEKPGKADAMPVKKQSFDTGSAETNIFAPKFCNDNVASSSCSHDLSYGNTIDVALKKSSDLLVSRTSKSIVTDNAGESVDPQVHVSEIANIQSRRTMHRVSGLVQMLRASDLRRSLAGKPLRVEVKEEKQINERHISSSRMSSNNCLNKETTGSIGINPSEMENNRKKSSVGSSNMDEQITGSDSRNTTNVCSSVSMVNRERLCPGASSSTKESRSKKQSVTGKETIKATREPLRPIINSLPTQNKKFLFQNKKVAGKENTNLEGSRPLAISSRGNRKPATNNNLRSFQQENIQAKQCKQENMLLSIQDIRKWERDHGRSYYCLSKSEKEKANREIRTSKSRMKLRYRTLRYQKNDAKNLKKHSASYRISFRCPIS